MVVYVIRDRDSGPQWHYVMRDERNPSRHAKDEYGRPRWTTELERALDWLHHGGPQIWLAWWSAFWSASGEDPPRQAEMHQYEDPTRAIGNSGED